MALNVPARLSRSALRLAAAPSRRYASSTTTIPFSPHTHTPDERFNSPNVNRMLQQSILHQFSEHEQKTRIQLAACYRLFELKHWNENIYNHLTAKVQEPDGSESFLINPFGLRYGEITASSLIKIGANGKILHPGTTGDLFGVNEAGFVIHSAIHRARPDLQSVMHCHYPAAAGVSAVKQGFLELTQTCHQVGPVAYHDYQGVVVDRKEQASLVDDLGEKNIMFLRNHGVITAGPSVGAAWYLMYQLLMATEMQSHASACAVGDVGNLNMPAEFAVQKTFDLMNKGTFSGAEYGSKELSAYMRYLDRVDASFRI